VRGEARFPEESDLVSVTVKGVEYYGYVDKVEYDLRCPGVYVEFFPGRPLWFDLSDVTIVEHPKPA
jgi:hypothetical protein